MIEAKRPNYTVGICCPSCEREMKDCDCAEYESACDDETLDDPRHGQARDINREWKR